MTGIQCPIRSGMKRWSGVFGKTGMEYGSAMFLENARYHHYLEQLVRMAKRTAWTIQKQICKGEFVPAGFETKFSVGERCS